MDSIETLRLQLLANGYTPLRNLDKRCFLTDWPTVEVTPETIAQWSRTRRHAATGLRVENGLAVIDFDIDDETTMTALVDTIFERTRLGDESNGPLLVRKGKGAKEAWFVRTEEPFSRLHSRAWLAPGADEDAGQSAAVEIFGGASARQFGAFGAHTVDDEGRVVLSYRWVDASPADTLQSELPRLSKSELAQIVDIAEEVLGQRGWTPVRLSQKGENDAVRVYDLTEEMQFDLDTGERVSLQRLRELAGGEPLRCSASWLEGPSAVNPSRCIVGQTRSGNLTIWESASAVTHLEASAKPRDFGPVIDRIAEKLREIEDRRHNKVRTSDDHLKAAAKLLNTYAYCPAQVACVVPIWASHVSEGYTLPAMRTLLLPNCGEEIGPRGGVVRINPLDLWSASDKRVTVDGLRMRPDKPRPTYEEAGKVWVNVYSPPAHDEPGGDAQPGIDFIEHLVPDPEERTWLLRWLSFKLRWPAIPGPAVVMVAHKVFGTGRGTFGELCARLLGRQYVRTLPYAAFMGRTYQSQYNEWLAEALMVVVSESTETVDGSTFSTKRNAYEHLKELVEPRPIEREISVKGRSNYRAVSSTTFLIATNHADALPVPEHDRRICVLRNGGTREAGYWEQLNLWMDDPANVAAFHAWLVGLDLGDYSPFAPPPVFEGKARMVEEAKSDVDRALDVAVAALSSPVFTAEQIETLMRRAETTHDLILPRSNDRPLSVVVRKIVAGRFHRVGVRNGRNWHPMIEGKRVSVYALTARDASQWSDADPEDLRAHVLVNGSISPAGAVSKLPLASDTVGRRVQS